MSFIQMRKITVTQMFTVYIYTCNYGLLSSCLHKESEGSTLTDLSKYNSSVVMSWQSGVNKLPCTFY